MKLTQFVAAAAAITFLVGTAGPASAQWGYGNKPWSNWNTGPWWTPYNSRPHWNNMPWNTTNNRWGPSPFATGFSQPWNNMWYSTMGNGWNRNGPWQDMPFMGRLGPTGGPAPFAHVFPDPTDPKGSLERIWDESLTAPSRFGRMPGGWKAPSISVPNPIDVGDQFGEAAYDMPGEMRTFNIN